MKIALRLACTITFLVSGAIPCWAGQVTIGSFVFGNPLSTLQGFEVVNETGPQPNGCDQPDGIPACTVLAFANTTLTVTLSDNSTLTRTPSGGFSFVPGDYIYGDNLGDDQAQSFLFDNSLTITAATLTGIVTPSSFSVTDGTNQSTFFSSGSFSVTLDLSGAPSLAAADITTSDTVNTPEPAAFLLAMATLLPLIRSRR